MSTEIQTEKDIVVNDYATVQAKSFAYLDTVAAQWKMCPIIGADKAGTIFGIPKGFRNVAAWTELNKHTLGSVSSFTSNDSGFASCELCGHDIKNQFPIMCESKQIYMYVGSECVNNFSGAGFTHKKVVEYKESTLSKVFNAWRGIAITESWSNPIFYDVNVFTQKPFAINGKMAIKHEVWQFQNKLSKYFDMKNLYTQKQIDQMKSNPFQTRKDIAELTPRQIQGMFKKAKKLGYIIPDVIEPFLNTKKTRSKEE